MAGTWGSGAVAAAASGALPDRFVPQQSAMGGCHVLFVLFLPTAGVVIPSHGCTMHVESDVRPARANQQHRATPRAASRPPPPFCRRDGSGERAVWPPVLPARAPEHRLQRAEG